ncbi:primosomal protein N' [Acetobacter sp. DsW_063]|uniref:primosomal protein N' n=1 Tax=Acetobacter sp. DsW_063 TaxID=1514894 RepID=UPI000A36A8CA|nr:primosomal protein N' [Acetobacter sp. DsW_063]OUJ14897.1 primosome assembly protein PriA [Acetobacter sp. DsW_063]
MAQTSLLEPQPPRKRVAVLLPLPFPCPLDYAAPPTLADSLRPGVIVSVPLGGRRETGVVWDQTPLPLDLAPPPPPEISDSRLRAVSTLVDAPPMPEMLRRFIDWVAAYTLAPPGMVLAMALRPHLLGTQAGPRSGWGTAPTLPDGLRMTPARRSVLAALEEEAPLSGVELARRAGVGAAVIRGLADAGALLAAPLGPIAPFAAPDPDHNPPVLSGAQDVAATALRALTREHRFSATLLEGVTGSGKTEIYLEAVAECIAAGRQALVLLPEIALSAQWMERFARRFGVTPATWHSEIGQRARRLTWNAVGDGSARVVVGARSALFLPFHDLGLIIVDEEHEATFKQEEGVTYNARDMAVVRARLANAPVVLASATPSLETLNNVETGRYGHLVLPSRHGGAAMPTTRLIDMRMAPPPRGRFLSPALIDEIGATLSRGEQAMLFLNRRGYAPLTLCRTCGQRMECPHCTSWLVEHRKRKILCCHHCDYRQPIPETCPQCGAEHSLTAIGPGIERITEEAEETFPNARVLVMASDTVGGPAAISDAVERIAQREIDLIVGTQIVAKGWHFPHLTTVGVVDADLGLGGADLRAGERTIQLLHQVAGRAGRAEAPGRVLLQSYAPEHPVMEALVSGDFRAFMEEEARQRQPGFWPPFGRLAALIVSSENPEAAQDTARRLGRAAPEAPGVEVLGPAPAPLGLLRGRHRHRLLLRTRRAIAVQPILRQWLAEVKVGAGVRVDVDVDPVSFL